MKNKLYPLAILLFVICFSFKPSMSQVNQWEKQNPPLTGSELTDVCFINDNQGWIVGQNGVILTTNDQGNNWQFQDTPAYAPPRLYSVSFTDSLHGWTAGGVLGHSYILQTTDGGINWQKADMPDPQAYITKIHFTNIDTGYILLAQDSNNYMFTMDGGQSWTTNTLTNSALYDISFLNDSTGFICGGNGYIAKTTDAGVTWQRSSVDESSLFIKVQMIDENTGYAAHFSGKIYKTSDGAQSWQKVFEFTLRFQMNALHVFNADTAIVIGSFNPNFIIKTTDGGVTWNMIDTGIAPQIRNWYFIHDNLGYGVTWEGSIIKITDCGESFQEVTSGTGDHIYSLSFSDAYNGMATTGDGKILLTDNGADWQEKDGPTANLIKNSLLFAPGQYMVTSLDSIYTTQDHGDTWQTQVLEQSVYQTGRVPNSNRIYLMTFQGQLWLKDSIADTFQLAHANSNELLWSDIFFLNENTVFSTDSHGSLFKSTNGGIDWQPVLTIDNFNSNAIYFLDEQIGWLGGSKKTGMDRQPVFYQTTDGGATWKMQDSFIYLEDNSLPDDVPHIESGSILDIQSTNGQTLYAFNNRYVFCSTDSGATWYQQPMDFYSGNYLTSLCLVDQDNVWAAGNSRFIWKRSNTPVSAIEQPATRPDKNSCGFYPNPFNATVVINFHVSNTSVGENSNVKIYNMLGQEIYTKELSIHSGENKFSWSPDYHIGSGLYFVRINTPAETFTGKVLYVK